MDNQQKVVKLWNIVFYIVMPLILGYLAIFGGSCTTVDKLIKQASVTTYATIDIHDYTLKLTKLPAGSIPSNSKRLLLSDSTLINITWTQSFSTKPYDEQNDPITHGNSSTVIEVLIPDDHVDYDEAATTHNATWSGYIKFSSGEWDLQLDNGIFNATTNTVLRSKFSDAAGLYIDVVQDPALAPAEVNIIIGG